MDSALQARLTQGIRKLQGLIGEQASSDAWKFPCIVGAETMQETLTEGGWRSVSSVGISITLPDILSAKVVPAFGDTVLLTPRNRSYRLSEITPTQSTWEIRLIDLTE